MKIKELKNLAEISLLAHKAFCATGEGGGIDNSCSGNEGGSSDGNDKPSSYGMGAIAEVLDFKEMVEAYRGDFTDADASAFEKVQSKLSKKPPRVYKFPDKDDLADFIANIDMSLEKPPSDSSIEKYMDYADDLSVWFNESDTAKIEKTFLDAGGDEDNVPALMDTVLNKYEAIEGLKNQAEKVRDKWKQMESTALNAVPIKSDIENDPVYKTAKENRDNLINDPDSFSIDSSALREAIEKTGMKLSDAKARKLAGKVEGIIKEWVKTGEEGEPLDPGQVDYEVVTELIEDTTFSQDVVEIVRSYEDKLEYDIVDSSLIELMGSSALDAFSMEVIRQTGMPL